MTAIPVLMYHHVNPNAGDMITVTPEEFAGQMRHIKESGYRTLGLDEAISFMAGGLKTDGKAVVVTFDDGYLDNYIYAYPVLKTYGIKAAIFIVTSWADAASKVGGDKKHAIIEDFRQRPLTHGYSKALVSQGLFHKVVMDWSMAREMASGGLVEFQSHTHTHAMCDALKPAELAGELELSRAAVEREMKAECRYLCWPKGRFNAASVAAAKKAGYRGLFTTAHGVIREGDDPLAVKRIVVKDGAAWLKSRLRIYTNPLLAGVYSRLKG